MNAQQLPPRNKKKTKNGKEETKSTFLLEKENENLTSL
jgi:hypothetical protein